MKPSQGLRSTTNLDKKLISENMKVVFQIAGRLARWLPASISRDDLVGAGALGLIDSVRRRRKGNEVAFATYTRIRIRGAMLDELRCHDWLPRRARSSHNSERPGEPPPLCVVRFGDLSASTERNPRDQTGKGDPLENLTRSETISRLKKELEQLQERDRLVLHLYYFRDMRLKEIGRLLGVTEARVSQIHHRALSQLKPKMQFAA